MAHYAITVGGATQTVSGWDESDAVDKVVPPFDESVESPEFTIRPATVREALTAEYGESWPHNVDVAKRSWFTYETDGAPYATGYQPLRHIWNEAEVIVLANTMGRCVHGYEETVDVANYRVLKDRWADVEGLSDGPYSGSSHIALDLDKEAPEDLTEVIDALGDYPVLDDDEYNVVEQEMITEHWESYGKSDAKRAVEQALGDDVELTDAAVEIIDRLTFDGILDYGCGGGYPTFIDSSAVDFGTEEVAKFISEHFGTLVKFDRYGTAVELDLTRTNLVAE